MEKYVIAQIKDFKINFLDFYEAGERKGESTYHATPHKKLAQEFTYDEVSAAIANLTIISNTFPMEGTYHAIAL